jgi:very-short-patch-repair endonuclease
MYDLSRLLPFSRAQHGLVAMQQAIGAGMPRRAWYRAIDSGRLRRVAPGVARFPGAPESSQQRILTSILAIGPTALASHRSAAMLWGFDIHGDRPVDVIVSDRRRGPLLDRTIFHRPTDLDDLRPYRRDGIPSCNPLRVLVDLGAVAPLRVEDFLAHVIIEGWVTRRAAEAALLRHARRGRHGVEALRQALDDWPLGDKPPDSVLEPEMRRLLQRHELPGFEFHPIILGWEVDFARLDAMVVVEVDGWERHGRDREQFERDRRRDAELQAAGWVVFRFTWLQVKRKPTMVAAALRDALTHRTALLGTPRDGRRH